MILCTFACRPPSEWDANQERVRKYIEEADEGYKLEGKVRGRQEMGGWNVDE